MNLGEVNIALGHKIVSGSEYHWRCYPDARFLEYESDYAHASVIYSTVNQEIYEAEISVKRDAWPVEPKPYRWLNPDTRDFMITESEQRKVDWQQAWDDVKWVDLDLEQDFFEKAIAIFNGQEFDKRVQMELDLDDDTLLKLAKGAHKRDVTINKYIEEILQYAIDQHKSTESV
jgi:hypothetical protein